MLLALRAGAWAALRRTPLCAPLCALPSSSDLLPPPCLLPPKPANFEPPRTPGAQGTWACSIRGDCHFSVKTDSGVQFLRILKALRIFRIFWILKHFKMIRLSTLLGRMQVRLAFRGVLGGGAAPTACNAFAPPNLPPRTYQLRTLPSTS